MFPLVTIHHTVEFIIAGANYHSAHADILLCHNPPGRHCIHAKKSPLERLCTITDSPGRLSLGRSYTRTPTEQTAGISFASLEIFWLLRRRPILETLASVKFEI